MERLAAEEDVTRPKTVCERCGSDVEGVVLAGVGIPLRFCAACAEAVIAEDEAREKARALDVSLSRAGRTAHLADLTLETHPDAAAVAVARGWLDAYQAGERRNLWLYGPPGLRKTGLAWGIIRELAEREVERYFGLDEEYRSAEPRSVALFVVWRDLYDDLVASFRAVSAMDHEAAADPRRLLSRAKAVPVLCLDDLGAGRAPTPYALEQLEILVDRRYQGALPTILTSNLPSSRELAARLGHEDGVAGKRIVSRLVEGAIRHEFSGANVRRPAA